MTPEKLQEQHDRIKAWLLGATIENPPTYHALFYGLTEKNISCVITSVCHAALVDYKYTCIGGGFHPQNEKQQVVAEKFWDWLSGPKSPWKRIFEDNKVELIVNDKGFYKGWIIQEPKIPFELLKNFLVVTRIFTEKFTYYITTWDKLVDLGADPRDAFYLLNRHYILDSGLVNAFGTQNAAGSHWPLTDWETICVDWDAYWTGNIDYDKKALNGGQYGAQVSVNRWFSKKGSNHFMFDVGQCSNVVTGKFTKTKVANASALLEQFYKWKAKYVPEQYQVHQSDRTESDSSIHESVQPAQASAV